MGSVGSVGSVGPAVAGSGGDGVAVAGLELGLIRRRTLR